MGLVVIHVDGLSHARVGGHGSIGGDQLHPFLLVKKGRRVDASAVTSTSDLYPKLVAIRDLVR